MNAKYLVSMLEILVIFVFIDALSWPLSLYTAYQAVL